MPGDTDNQLLQQALTAAGGIPRPGDTTNALLRKLVFAIGAVISGGGGSTGGSGVLIGHGVPAASLGSDGNIYFDLDSSDVYEKVGGAWVLEGNLAGAGGAAFIQGSGAPDDGENNDGDSYLDIASGKLYLKLAGTWTLQVTLEMPSHSTLAYAASVEIDFNSDDYRTLTLDGNVEFTTANRGAGKSISIRIDADEANRNFTFPAGWTWLGIGAPASITANKTAVLTVTCFGAADADIIAAYAVEP